MSFNEKAGIFLLGAIVGLIIVSVLYKSILHSKDPKEVLKEAETYCNLIGSKVAFVNYRSAGTNSLVICENLSTANII